MKVLFVFTHPAPYKVDLFNGLAPHVDLTVMFERHSSGFRHPLFYVNANYKFRAIFLGGINIGAENHCSREIIRHLRKNTYDLIIMNGYSSLTEMMTIFYLQNHGIPYVLYINGGVIHADPKWRFALKRKLVSGAKAFFSPTKHIDSYLLHYGAEHQRIIHYPYATVFANQLAKERANAEERDRLLETYGVPTGAYFISAGQFISRKNNMQTLKYWAHSNRSENLLLVGSGPDEGGYRQLVKDHKMSNVFILSYLPKAKLLPLIHNAIGFIILSHEDIYGHVVNESLSQGTPVISSPHVMASRELLREGKNGFLVNTQDDTSIDKALSYVKTHDMFDACVATSAAYTIEAMVTHHLEAFKKLVK